MKHRIHKFQQTAGLFVGLAILGSFAFFLGLLMKKGIFEAKVTYYTLLDQGDGVREGAAVEMSGVRVGSVAGLEFDEKNRIRTRLSILKKYQKHIREDSRIQLLRPFVIGDKILYLIPGSGDEQSLPVGSVIPSEEIFGLTDLLNGRKLTPYMKTFEKVAKELQKLVELLLEEEGSVALVESLKGMPAMVRGVTEMSHQLAMVGTQMADEDKIRHVVANLAVLTEEFKKVLPALAVVAPDLPRSSRKVVEALDEAVVVLKAMQRTFLLRSSVQEVREEELAEQPNSQSQSEPLERSPASQQQAPKKNTPQKRQTKSSVESQMRWKGPQ